MVIISGGKVFTEFKFTYGIIDRVDQAALVLVRAGPMIGLTVPALLLLVNKSFGVFLLSFHSLNAVVQAPLKAKELEIGRFF